MNPIHGHLCGVNIMKHDGLYTAAAVNSLLSASLMILKQKLKYVHCACRRLGVRYDTIVEFNVDSKAE